MIKKNQTKQWNVSNLLHGVYKIYNLLYNYIKLKTSLCKWDLAWVLLLLDESHGRSLCLEVCMVCPAIILVKFIIPLQKSYLRQLNFCNFSKLVLMATFEHCFSWWFFCSFGFVWVFFPWRYAVKESKLTLEYSAYSPAALCQERQKENHSCSAIHTTRVHIHHFFPLPVLRLMKAIR